MASARAADRKAEAILRDPGVSHGRFRVYPRTDGKWIVYDPERPAGNRTVGEPHSNQERAEQAALGLAVVAARAGGGSGGE